MWSGFFATNKGVASLIYRYRGGRVVVVVYVSGFEQCSKISREKWERRC
jgi:hypothetical protein